ncbi:PilT/PilU family type 4a pilus ATPase [Marinospirillum perlucidum]|uniref:PilT/PilU family type 4a pilus ATPase n=1 Tax=Marinospirillum perlucidum TaxID=1982602 RepID=UPI000DF2E16C|nr:PilT/PilU family type 4a pilus ATPase [Marinospirillum perlucidum]
MKFTDFLKQMAERKGSDLFITTGMMPSMKVDGQLTALTEQKLSPEQARELVFGVMNQEQKDEFRKNKECNFAISAPGIGRFRVSAFYQRNQVGMVLRRIEFDIPQLDSLHLPEIIKDLAMTQRGLILFVGATGTGKSTSLASMIQYRNENARGHIISIEDPIEFIHPHKQCIVTQREVGIDTESFEVALKNTLRQAPDVIMIGEVRNRETMEYALAFAETGHLCLATLHANNADQALERVINFFPQERHNQVFMDLSLNLRGIVAQQLLPTLDGKGRRAAIEVLLNTPLVRDIIRKGEVHQLKGLMKKSRESGMQTFDQALFDLYNLGEISEEEALQHADSPNDLRLMIKLGSADAGNTSAAFDRAASKFSLEDD